MKGGGWVRLIVHWYCGPCLWYSNSAICESPMRIIEVRCHCRVSRPCIFIWICLAQYLSDDCCRSYYHRALEAVRERRYEDVIPLLEKELPLLTEPSEILRDCTFIARFALMKEDTEVSSFAVVSYISLAFHRVSCLNTSKRATHIHSKYSDTYSCS